MIVLIDANVLISATLARASVPARVMNICKDNEWSVAVSGETVEEYRRAMLRKAKWPANMVFEAVAALREAVDIVDPTMRMPWPGLKDAKDRHLFDAALFTGAEILVTGDKIVRAYAAQGLSLKVLTPREFVESFA